MKSCLDGFTAFKHYLHVGLGSYPSLSAHPHPPGWEGVLPFHHPQAKPDLGSQLKETAACLGKFAELFKQVIKNWASLVAQWWEICLPVQETWV